MSFASFAKRVIKRSRAPYAAYVAQTRKPILQNMCLLEAGQGKNINGNMFALARAIETLPQYAHLRAAFVVTEDTESQARDRFSHYGIDGVELVARNSPRYKELLARAHYLFTDNSLPTYFFKRDGQVYVNTWHGTPLKHLGHSDLENAIASMANVQKNMLAADYLVFPNELTKSVFWDDYQLRTLFSHRVLMCDYPRNDALLDQGAAQKVRDAYNLGDKNVVAYMPTWRGARRSADVEGQKAQIHELLREIDSKLTGHDLFYVNLHFLVTGGMDFSAFEHVRPFPSELETYDFLAACDTLVTDYSSVFFDFAVTNRKIVLFAYDKDEYLSTKGTYLDYDALPFPIAETPSELVPLISTSEHSPYSAFREEFCRHATGHACEDVLDVALGVEGARLQPLDNPSAREHVGYYASSTGNAALNDIVCSELERLPENDEGVFICAGKYGDISLNLLNNVARTMPYLALVSSHVQTTPEKYALFLASRSRLAQLLFSPLLRELAHREVARLLPGIKFGRIIDLNANASYFMKMLSFSSMQHEGILRDGSLTRLRREVQTRRLLGRYPTSSANAVSDRQVISKEASQSYFTPGMQATLLTRHHRSADDSYLMRGLITLRLARGVDFGNLVIEFVDGREVGHLRKVAQLGHGILSSYEIRVPRSILPDLPIHNQIYLRCHASDGMSGGVRIRYNIRDRQRSSNRVSGIWVDATRGTTSYFRQAAKNTLCFSTRDTVSIDAPGERLKIAVARALTRVVPIYRRTILLYEKNASRYEESASVVFERLIGEGHTNARFILSSHSADFDLVDQKYRPYLVRKNSMRHYMMFFSAKTFIGTEMLAHAIDLRPANRCVSRRLSAKNINYVFLQHGVMYMISLDSESRTFFKPKKLRGIYRIVTSSEAEKSHFVDRGGYDPSTLYVCGLPKYDRNSWSKDADLIAIMPTWRPWEYNAARAHFSETSYYQFIVTAINAVPKQLREKIIVLPHPLFKAAAEGQHSPYESLFEDGSESYDAILRRTRLLITDYSSIAYDAFYRGANVLFFWQDLEECLAQYGAGTVLMIDDETAFGDVVRDPATLSSEEFLRAYEGPQSEEHLGRYRSIVEFHDGRNTDRLMKLMHEDGLI